MDAYYGQKEEFWKEKKIRELESLVKELQAEVDKLKSRTCVCETKLA